MEMKIPAIAITAVVVVIVLAGVLMPVLDDATATEDTFKNGGFFTYDAVTEGTSVVISFDPSTPNVVSVGDKIVTMPEGTGTWSICGSENFTVRYVRSSTSSNLQCYGTAGYIAGDPGNPSQVVTATVSDTSMVFARNVSTTKTYTMGSHGFVINPEGKGALMLKYSDEAAYVHGDSEIYLCGTTFVTGSGTNDYVGVFGYGSVDDGVTLSSFYGNTGDNTVSFGTPTITYVEDADHKDLYQISKVDFALTQNSATVDATYSYFVVPSEVTAERSVHFSDNQNAIFAAIPIMVIVALLIAVVALVFRSRQF